MKKYIVLVRDIFYKHLRNTAKQWHAIGCLSILIVFGSFVVLGNAQGVIEPTAVEPTAVDIITTPIDIQSPQPPTPDTPIVEQNESVEQIKESETTYTTSNDTINNSIDEPESIDIATTPSITHEGYSDTGSSIQGDEQGNTDQISQDPPLVGDDTLVVGDLVGDSGSSIQTQTLYETDTGVLPTDVVIIDDSTTTIPSNDQLIIHTKEILQTYILQGLIVPLIDPDTTMAKDVWFKKTSLYHSPQGLIQIKISDDTHMSTTKQGGFDPSQFKITDTTLASSMLDYSSVIIEKYDPFTDTTTKKEIITPDTSKTEEFHIGIVGTHLIFDKPLEVVMDTDQQDSTIVELRADHGYGWSQDGISTDISGTCSGGLSDKPETITKVHNGKIIFYICGASTFSLTYVGGANTGNFADANFINRTVTFVPGVHFATGSIISDVNISIRRRPIDTENPLLYGNTNCYPNEKYFRLTGPDGTIVNLINAGQLSAPNPNCPETTTIFDDSGSAVITGNYTSGIYKPVQALSAYNTKSPFGVWTLRMGDTALFDGVILFGYTITIKVIDPPLCIYSPVSVLTGIVVKNTSQLIDQQLDYFQVDDQRGLNSGYYTTLQISNLVQSGGSAVIPNTSIQRKADPLVLLSGTTNPLVQLGTSRSSYATANTTTTFIFRNTGANGLKTSRYGSKLRLRVNVPAYASVGIYTGTITYTLYEN